MTQVLCSQREPERKGTLLLRWPVSSHLCAHLEAVGRKHQGRTRHYEWPWLAASGGASARELARSRTLVAQLGASARSSHLPGPVLTGPQNADVDRPGPLHKCSVCGEHTGREAWSHARLHVGLQQASQARRTDPRLSPGGLSRNPVWTPLPAGGSPRDTQETRTGGDSTVLEHRGAQKLCSGGLFLLFQ